ncbi:hypothetical protein [Chitinimonas sp.]|uniref:hypothetical protein n=1 Tax=Chitinimonas sp. TaxID=1934313 RepID=UPI0035B4A70E
MKKSLIALSLLAATSAFAGPTQPVTELIGNTGDLLLAPVFNAGQGWNTEIKVVNTSTTLSTVAKVVYYDQKTSAELLDFLIYLSPGDVWTGNTTCLNATCGSVGVVSTDDSWLKSDGTFPKVGESVTFPFARNQTVGYVGVFEAAAFNAGAAPLAKTAVKAAYDGLAAGYFVEANTPNILSGKARMVFNATGVAAALPMTAIANYDNVARLSPQVFTGFGSEAGSSSLTTTAQLETLIWGNNWVLPYDSAQGLSIASVTFPTRRTYECDNAALQCPTRGGAAGVGVYPFNNTSDAPVVGAVVVRDNAEQAISQPGQVTSPPQPTFAPKFDEVGFLTLSAAANNDNTGNAFAGLLNNASTGAFTAGWANLSFAGGVPAVVTQMVWNVTGSGVSSFEWFYPSNTGN